MKMEMKKVTVIEGKKMSYNLGECNQNLIDSWGEEEKEVKSNA